jgi:hypothetical protein
MKRHEPFHATLSCDIIGYKESTISFADGQVSLLRSNYDNNYTMNTSQYQTNYRHIDFDLSFIGPLKKKIYSGKDIHASFRSNIDSEATKYYRTDRTIDALYNTVSIDRLDTVYRRMSGTFKMRLYRCDNTNDALFIPRDTIYITNGMFHDIYLH